MNYKELEKYIKQLFQQYFNKYRLPLEDKQDIIQDAMFRLFKKEQDGTLVGDVENNKNYIFITVKNFTLQRIDKVIKKNNHSQLNEELEVPSTETNSFDLTDLNMKKELIYKVLEDKSFTDLDRRIIDHMFNGYKTSEIVELENIRKNIIRNSVSRVKIKLKEYIENNGNYKFIVTMKDGTKYKFRKQKDLAKKLGILNTTFSYWKKHGRTQFKHFHIEYLTK
jgi:DNA-directed RNA polymerase specialized sigma24 family protein